MERGGTDDPEVQTCARDESCRSNAVHGIFTLSTPRSDACDGNLTVTSLESNMIRPSSGALSRVGLSTWLMNWKSCGVLNMI